MADVTLEGVGKVYANGVDAVRGLDLEIGDGEFLVLVGPSGSGKSTALRMIAGLEFPTAGRIFIGGHDVTDLPPQQRNIAMVFQNYALYPHMTVRQNLAFGLEMRRTPRAEADRLVRDVAGKLDLIAVLERRPAALSGGQRQRVALGRAIVREPTVFLFDEPLSNLDARLRVQTRAELVRLHRQLATTMVYVTHDQTEAMTMGERIAVLHGGELQQVATPLDVYDSPANLTVAGFIGSPSMNTFAGVIRDDDDGRRFSGRSFEISPVHTAVVGEVVLGVRPEHVLLEGSPGDIADSAAAMAQAAPGGFIASVHLLEPLGSETLVYCRTPSGEDVALRTATRPDLAPEAAVTLRLDPRTLHFFDAATGQRLCP